MDMKKLESLIRVAEHGSLTKAALAMNTSPSILSRRIRQLEVDLRQHLLDRDGRGVTPTESGKRLIAHGRGILNQVEMAKRDLSTHRKLPTGKVVIGVPISLSKHLTVNLVATVRTQYPDASINIMVGPTDTLCEWLLRGRIDFALIFDPPSATSFTHEHLWVEDLCLLAPSLKHPILKTVPMAKLPEYPLIVHSYPNTLRNRIDLACRDQNIVLNIAMEIDSIEATLELIERGFGYSILSGQIIHGSPVPLKLQAARIVSPKISRKLCLSTFTERPLTSLAQLAIKLIKQEIKATNKPTRQASRRAKS